MAGLVASVFNVKCIRSWRPFCSGCPGSIRSGTIPTNKKNTDSLLSPASPRDAKGVPLSVRITFGSP